MWHMYWKEKRKGENFYSHIPCEMWRSSVVSVTFSYLFLLTHPVWDVTPTLHKQISDLLYFYSHIPCGMWRFGFPYDITFFTISTHTSRVGCDYKIADNAISGQLNFYSHIPCGMWHIYRLSLTLLFHFYSHIPCGMWRKCHRRHGSVFLISTHTSRVGCDVIGQTRA